MEGNSSRQIYLSSSNATVCDEELGRLGPSWNPRGHCPVREGSKYIKIPCHETMVLVSIHLPSLWIPSGIHGGYIELYVSIALNQSSIDNSCVEIHYLIHHMPTKN